jgi:prepilin peptidase CpaA
MINLSLTSVLPAFVLGLALCGAVWNDVRARRIPNKLILAGTASALLLHLLVPAGAGLFSTPAGGQGLMFSLTGFGAGLLLLLPFYALRALGAGDVKLMAMVGAFIGPAGVLGATLLSMLAGGVLALTVALWSGQLAQVAGNVQHMLRSAVFRGIAGVGATIDQPASTTGKLAYAVAIACGTVGQLILADWPAWRYFS